MKKILIMLFAIILCIGLCACGGGKDIELPTKPVQAAAPNQSVMEPQSSTHAAEENAEAAEPTGETYPWEAEFNEEDYFVYTHTEPKVGKFTSYLEGNMFGQCVRTISEYTNGDTSDTYFYPNGVDSHSYNWYADGSYTEYHHLDDGRIDLEEMKTYLGTTIYFKQVNPDGTWNETQCDEEGNVTYSASLDADGTLWKYQRFEDGTSRDASDNPNTGYHSESEYFATGNTKKTVYKDADRSYSEDEYYENGNLKYGKYTTPEYTAEERYDEEGFRTYYYMKGTDWEQECIADETGKLVKVIENGSEIQNPAIIAQYAKDYNFKE